jgi:hypothetical protein
MDGIRTLQKQMSFNNISAVRQAPLKTLKAGAATIRDMTKKMSWWGTPTTPQAPKPKSVVAMPVSLNQTPISNSITNNRNVVSDQQLEKYYIECLDHDILMNIPGSTADISKQQQTALSVARDYAEILAIPQEDTENIVNIFNIIMGKAEQNAALETEWANAPSAYLDDLLLKLNAQELKERLRAMMAENVEDQAGNENVDSAPLSLLDNLLEQCHSKLEPEVPKHPLQKPVVAKQREQGVAAEPVAEELKPVSKEKPAKQQHRYNPSPHKKDGGITATNINFFEETARAERIAAQTQFKKRT